MTGVKGGVIPCGLKGLADGFDEVATGEGSVVGPVEERAVRVSGLLFKETFEGCDCAGRPPRYSRDLDSDPLAEGVRF